MKTEPELIAAVRTSPSTGLRVVRASLLSKMNYLQSAIESCENRAAVSHGPVPDACRLLAIVYTRVLKELAATLDQFPAFGGDD